MDVSSVGVGGGFLQNDQSVVFDSSILQATKQCSAVTENDDADVIKKLRHRKHMLLSTDYWRKHFEKWSGYPVSAATETWVKVMILSSQARVSRNDSTIELKVSATLR